jgi:hypothetical protein
MRTPLTRASALAAWFTQLQQQVKALGDPPALAKATGRFKQRGHLSADLKRPLARELVHALAPKNFARKYTRALHMRLVVVVKLHRWVATTGSLRLAASCTRNHMAFVVVMPAL